jgi:hypothetical protein
MAFNPTPEQEAKCKAFAEEVTLPMLSRYLFANPYLPLKYITASSNLDNKWYDAHIAPGATTRMGTKVVDFGAERDRIGKHFAEHVDKVSNR